MDEPPFHLLVTSDVAARLRCSLRTVHELTRFNQIPTAALLARGNASFGQTNSRPGRTARALRPLIWPTGAESSGQQHPSAGPTVRAGDYKSQRHFPGGAAGRSLTLRFSWSSFGFSGP
jgi:hypothetical protein